MSAPTDAGSLDPAGEANPRPAGALPPEPADDRQRSAAGESDSSGLPWAGRSLVSPAFARDDGAPDPRLLELLVRPRPWTPDDEVQLLALLAHCRLLVPLVPAPPDPPTAPAPSGRRTPELAAVTLTGPDGQRALPVFTGLAALAAWEGAARPVPVTAREAAQAAVAEACDVLVLDVASSHTTVLRPSMLSALATGTAWTPAHRDPGVVEAMTAAVAGEPAVAASELSPAAPGSDALALTLRLHPGLDADQLSQLTLRVGQRLGAAAGLRSRIDELVLRLSVAEEE